MNEFKGTPGPWTLAGDDATHITDSAGRCIVDVPQPSGMPWSEERANVALILAARGLLNALRTLADVAESRGIPCDAARAAIAKALGKNSEVAECSDIDGYIHGACSARKRKAVEYARANPLGGPISENARLRRENTILRGLLDEV